MNTSNKKPLSSNYKALTFNLVNPLRSCLQKQYSINENRDEAFSGWKLKRANYARQSKKSHINSFQRILMSSSRISSIDMDFWRVLASQNDIITLTVVMFFVKCRFSMETNKAIDLFETWKERGGD